MNLAIGAVSLFFLFIVPGLIFRRFYYRGVFSRQYFKTNWFQVFSVALIPSVIGQVIWFLIFDQLWPLDREFLILSNLIGGSNSAEVAKGLSEGGNEIVLILSYNLTLWLAMTFAGITTRFLVRASKLDRKHKLFRFSNEWHYYLSGEFLDFPHVDGKAKNIAFKYIDALVEGSERILYKGILVDYQLTSEGSGLNYLVLRDVKRRKLFDDPREENPTERYYTIPSNLLIIPYHHIINLNIRYIFLD